MFKKPFKVTTTNTVKRSVKRNLIIQLKKEYPNLTDEEWNELIPPKQELTLCKMSNSYTLIYMVENNPYFFDVDGRNNLYPTVYCLWKAPKLMNTLIVQPNTFSFLLNGADLFLPGVLVPEAGLEWRVNAKHSVTLLVSGLPIAVGYSIIDTKYVDQNGMKGKGVKILHYYKDHLWELGCKSKPEQHVGWKMSEKWPGYESHYALHGAEPAELDVLEAGDGNGEENEDEKGQGEGEGEGKEEEKEKEKEKEKENENAEGGESTDNSHDSISPQEMDKLIKNAFLIALKTRVKKSEMPIMYNLFWPNYMVPSAAGTAIDLKHSTHKTLNAFLAAMAEEGFITIEELSPGVHHIIDVKRDQAELRAFAPPKGSTAAPSAAGGSASSSSSSSSSSSFVPSSNAGYTTSSTPGVPKSLIVELYGATPSLQGLFASLGEEKKRLYTKKEAIELLWKYADAQNLHTEGGKNCKLDELLGKALFKKGQEPPPSLPKQELSEMFIQKLSPYYEVNREDSSEIHKGQVKPIIITLEQRQGRKHVTKISGLESFSVNIETLADELRHICAASTTVKAIEGKQAGQEVLVQGLAVKQTTDHLINKYQIPKTYIQSMDRTKQKKK